MGGGGASVQVRQVHFWGHEASSRLTLFLLGFRNSCDDLLTVGTGIGAGILMGPSTIGTPIMKPITVNKDLIPRMRSVKTNLRNFML